MKYRFECTIDDNDYLEFNKFAMLYPNGKKQRFISTRLLLPIWFLVYWLIDLFGGEDTNVLILMFLFLSILSVIWIFSVKPLNLWWLKKSIRRLQKKGNKLYESNSVVEFFEDFFKEESDSRKEEIEYGAVMCVCDNEGKGVYIFENNVIAHIIPYSAFKSDEQKEAFLGFIGEKTGKPIITQKL